MSSIADEFKTTVRNIARVLWSRNEINLQEQEIM
jgi:hypothetical protein